MKVIWIAQKHILLTFWKFLVINVSDFNIDLIMSKHNHVNFLFLGPSSIVKMFGFLTSDILMILWLNLNVSSMFSVNIFTPKIQEIYSHQPPGIYYLIFTLHPHRPSSAWNLIPVLTFPKTFTKLLNLTTNYDTDVNFTTEPLITRNSNVPSDTLICPHQLTLNH